jgi:riboflavin kinase/FMN adenylyltransferase
MSKKRVMQLVRGLHNLRPEHRGCVATIGNFDGFTVATRLSWRACASAARPWACPLRGDLRAAAARVLRPDTAPARLARLRDKVELLAAEGIDRVLCLASTSA